MMKFAADLHIHSCLSPCGDMSMTPNNIVNMAYLKGLDIIAVADHNSALNLPAISKLARERDILLIPAIEAESREEVHVLCYMPTLEAAMLFGEYLHENLPPVSNVPEIFGEQVVMDEADVPIAKEEYLLVQSTLLSINEICEKCRALFGVPIPAHINRPSTSVIASLGFIPKELHFTSVEVKNTLPPPNIDLSSYHVLYSSDAHYLEDILEREMFISLKEKSIEEFLAYIAKQKL